MSAMSHALLNATSVLDALHGGRVHTRRVRVLAARLAALLPAGASVLDVGAGDGRLAAAVASLRRDVRVEGIDVLVRPDAVIRVAPFDGERVSAADDTFDVAMCVDVLHHARDPRALLAEASRVASRVLLKDHLRDGWLAAPTLRWMDWVGNSRHGVTLPFNYLSRHEWTTVFSDLGLEIETWTSHVPLYPWPASLIFGRGLHFIALLNRRNRASCPS